jgi:hypothetical protein
MKRLILILAITIISVFVAASAVASEIPSITAYQAASPIVIDGSLDEWNLSSPAVIEDISQVIRDSSLWNGPNDLSCKTYVMWDETNLYLAMDVTEDSPYGAIDMLPLELEDNFKIYISTNPDDDPARGAYSTNDFLLYLIPDEGYWDTAFDRSMVSDHQRFVSKGMEGGESVLTGYEVGTAATEKGFIFEVVIPWANFSNSRIPVFTPKAGDSIKFNFAITDISYPCPGTEYIPQMAWTGDYRINTDPSTWGTLIFSE